MHRLILVCVAILFAAAIAPATRAQDAVERAYRGALAATPAPAALQREQEAWREQWTQYADERAYLEQSRIAELELAAHRHTVIRAARPSLATLATSCVDTGLGSCVIERTGSLVMPDGSTLYFQAQSGSSDEFGLSEAVVIFQPDGQRLRPIMWLFGALGVLDPATHSSFSEAGETGAGSTYVALPAYGQGTGRHWMGSLFRWNGPQAAATEIDAQSWLSDLGQSLPPGLDVWKGPAFEWESLIAHSPLWQEMDGNCCPTGGEVVVDLKVEGDRLVLGNVSVTDTVLTVAGSVDPAVLEWVARQQQCQHWMGEEAYDAGRGAEIRQAVSRLRCETVQAEEASLRTRFTGDAPVLAMIDRARGYPRQ